MLAFSSVRIEGQVRCKLAYGVFVSERSERQFESFLAILIVRGLRENGRLLSSQTYTPPPTPPLPPPHQSLITRVSSKTDKANNFTGLTPNAFPTVNNLKKNAKQHEALDLNVDSDSDFSDGDLNFSIGGTPYVGSSPPTSTKGKLGTTKGLDTTGPDFRLQHPMATIDWNQGDVR